MGSDARSDAQSGRTRWWLCAALWIALTGCAGGGGGDSVPGVEPEAPPPPTQTPPPGTPPAVAYAAAGEIVPLITNVDIPADGRPVVNFQLADGDNFIIVDLSAADIRFVITKLQTSPLGNLHGIWQSYLNEIEAPGAGPGTEQRLQATYERATSGTLTNNGDGTYEYRFAQVITDTNAMDPDVVAQAQSEGLDLTYDPMLTHRVSMQFDNAQQPANPFYDFLPSTGATSGILQAQIVTRTACNDCHDRLSFHGGNRIEMEYCVTCHNPGTTDANSGNSADFAEMTHKLHYGRELPSVQAGGSYQFYGFQDRLVDYSTVGYPQDIRNCSQCHAGPETAEADDVLTPQGDNWAEYPTRRACGACHDDLDFALHFGGQIDDENCRSCHALGGAAGSVEVSHEIAVDIAAAAFEYRVLAIGDTGQAEFPVVDFQVVDPTQNDAPYDIMNDPAWTQPAGASRLAVTVAWSTDDYTNTGNAEEEASSVVVDALATATDMSYDRRQIHWKSSALLCSRGGFSSSRLACPVAC